VTAHAFTDPVAGPFGKTPVHVNFHIVANSDSSKETSHTSINQDSDSYQNSGSAMVAPADPGENALVTRKDAFMPYPVSTLSPTIIPNDLTNFKSRGVSNIQKDTAQRLTQLRDEYYRVVDEFNWNKLIYESHFGFEPVIGQTYYLYRSQRPDEEFSLSMIEPERWNKPYIGAFSLGADGRWLVEDVAEGFSLKDYLESRKPADG
jgi:hypothetical protein